MTIPLMSTYTREIVMNNKLTASELAEAFHTDPRTVRKFLRSTIDRDAHPGRGHRWGLPGNKREINRLAKQFETWKGEHTRINS